MQIGDTIVVKHTATGLYVSSQKRGPLERDRTEIGAWERFTIVYITGDGTLVVQCLAHDHGALYSVMPTWLDVAGDGWFPFVLPG